jgi:F0F1-type ATP synthase membrane subunit b/b'
VIGLLMEKRVTYTEAEAEALVAQAKRLADASGRTVRAEAELLLSRDRETRLQDLRTKVAGAGELLVAITVEADDLRAEFGDEDGELAAIMATMAAFGQPFANDPAGGARSTTSRR